MKHVTSIIVAVLGLAALAPAQLHREGSLARHVQADIRVDTQRVDQPILRQRGGMVAHGGERDGRGGRGRGRGRDRSEHNSGHGGHGDHRGHNDHRGYGDHRGREHYRIVQERVWVPGYHREVRVPACYGWVYDSCGRSRWGIVKPACIQRVWVPGCYEVRQRRVRC